MSLSLGVELPGCYLEAVLLWDVLRVNLGPYIWGQTCGKKPSGAPRVHSHLPRLLVQESLSQGGSDTEHQKHSPQIMESIAFNPLSSSLVCVLGARAKNLLSYYMFLRLTKLFGFSAMPAMVGRTWVLYVTEKKQLFLIPLLF